MRKLDLIVAVLGTALWTLPAEAQQGATVAVPAPPAVPISPPSPMAALESREASDQKLRGSFLYVYSFLDVREGEYTPKVLAEFDAELTSRLLSAEVQSKILRFNQSRAGQEEFFAGNSSFGSESRAVPVLQTVARNLPEERAVGAKFRLIVFPSNYKSEGFWRYYDIRFMLMNAKTNRRLWSFVYSGRHMVMLKNSENAKARAKKILDRMFAELRANGFL